MKCNGCGGEFDTLGGALMYGNANTANSGAVGKKNVYADYVKTLCPRCQHVLKDILLHSDLSEQWDEYDWELMVEHGDFTEPYDD